MINPKVKYYLAGDSGGTKTELAVYKSESRKVFTEKDIIEKKVFTSKNYKSLEDVISEFLKGKNLKIDSACIGVAGPVFNGKTKITNLGWEINQKKLSAEFKINKFLLVNDIEPQAKLAAELPSEYFVKIYKGKTERNVLYKANKILIAPGTGLGQAAIVYTDSDYKIVTTEGGHCDFAPADKLQCELYLYLKRRFGRVSVERVISGEGILNIFDFLLLKNYCKVNPLTLKRIRDGDQASEISAAALKKKCRLCMKAMSVFISALGSHAGNMVLNYNATSGVYLGGGIPQKNLKLLKSGLFLKSYLDKGRLSYMVKQTPLFVIKDKSPGITGAGMILSEKG